MSELTDLQLCKRIAEIEDYVFDDSGRYFRCELTKRGKVVGYLDYNPLTDDALNHQLMVKYDVEIQLTKERDKTDISRGKYPKMYWANIGRIEATSSNPNKAILLAIIEANQ